MRGWRPLGKVLVDGGYVAERELEHALAEQRQHGRGPGEILVEHDYLSGPALAAALAEQHGGGDVRFRPDELERRPPFQPLVVSRPRSP